MNNDSTLENSPTVGLLATADAAATLADELRSAGLDVQLLERDSDAFRFEGNVVVETRRYESALQSAQMLARFSSSSQLRVALGIVSDTGEQRELLAKLNEIRAGAAVDLCLRVAVTSEAALRLQRVAAVARRTSATDALTGLGHRVGMREKLAQTLEDLPDTRSAAAFILDLDHFKAINDRYGHSAGDEVLQQCGFIVKSFGATGVRAFRLGGDEIGGVLVESSRPAVVETLESLCKAIASAKFTAGDQELRITGTIGFTFLTRETEVEDAFNQADSALYAAKNAGRNRVQPYDLCWENADEDAGGAAFAHLENVTRLWTERLSQTILSVARKAFEKSRETADRDGLTELYNRRYFDRRISRELANATAKRVTTGALSLVFFDVDNFHDVNVTYGYPTGDHALQQVAEAAGNHSRTTDWAARYGGEEFVVVMPDTTASEACLVAERLRAAVEAMTVHGFGDRTLKLTVSIGVCELAELDPDARSVEALVQLASDRVMEAKRTGKNRVVTPPGA